MFTNLFAICNLFLLTVTIIINVTFTSELTYSYLDFKENNKDIEEDLTNNEIEEIYLKFYSLNPDKYDLICALNNSKKIALCELIYNLPHYKAAGISLSKTVLYLERLSCRENELNFEFAILSANVKRKQNMYRCPGRHNIVRTSFIEDDFYDTFYLSSGPIENSITVYIHYYDDEYSDMFSVYDHIYNVPFSQLEDKKITLKDVLTELKLKKEPLIDRNIEHVSIMYSYSQEQKYLLDDSICNLDYGKKITLCSYILDQFDYLEVTLNKAAVFLFSTKCITRPIRTISRGYETILTQKQSMYTCHGRRYTSNTGNFLQDDFIKKFYVSNGPTRNSVFVYTRILTKEFGDIYAPVSMLENIDIRTLKPTTISLEEIKSESEKTYDEVLRMMTLLEMKYENQIKSIALNNKLDQNEEYKMIEKLVIQNENEYHEIFINNKINQSSNTNNVKSKSKNKKKKSETTSIKEELFNIDQENKIHQDPSLTETRDFLRFGFQIFKTLVEKNKQQLEMKTPGGRIKKKLEQIQKKQTNQSSTSQKLDSEIQLINKMELFVQNITTQQITADKIYLNTNGTGKSNNKFHKKTSIQGKNVRRKK